MTDDTQDQRLTDIKRERQVQAAMRALHFAGSNPAPGMTLRRCAEHMLDDGHLSQILAARSVRESDRAERGREDDPTLRDRKPTAPSVEADQLRRDAARYAASGDQPNAAAARAAADRAEHAAADDSTDALRTENAHLRRAYDGLDRRLDRAEDRAERAESVRDEPTRQAAACHTAESADHCPTCPGPVAPPAPAGPTDPYCPWHGNRPTAYSRCSCPADRLAATPEDGA
jgi:glycerol-3-phosphate O-acyltransferase